jgi:hypothetical protein
VCLKAILLGMRTATIKIIKFNSKTIYSLQSVKIESTTSKSNLTSMLSGIRRLRFSSVAKKGESILIRGGTVVNHD